MTSEVFSYAAVYAPLEWQLVPVRPRCPTLYITCDQARWNDPTDSRFDLSEWFELPDPPFAIGRCLGSTDLIAVTTESPGWFANSSGLLSALASHPTVSMERIGLRSWHRVT